MEVTVGKVRIYLHIKVTIGGDSWDENILTFQWR